MNETILPYIIGAPQIFVHSDGVLHLNWAREDKRNLTEPGESGEAGGGRIREKDGLRSKVD